MPLLSWGTGTMVEKEYYVCGTTKQLGLCFVLKKVFDPIAKQLTPIVPFWRVKFDNEEKNEGIFKGNLVHVVKCGLTYFSKELRHKRGLNLKCLRRNHEQI